MIDFTATDDQRAFAGAVLATLRDRPDRFVPDASPELWQSLAELDALALLTDEGGGSLADLVALMGALGSGGCPGSIVATVAAARALNPSERDLLSAGRLRVGLVVAGCLPGPDSTDVAIEIDGTRVWRVEVAPRPAGHQSLSGEVWAPTTTHRVEQLGDGPMIVLAAELGLGAALVGMARTLLEQGAAHARTRRQFGRTIGEFQGVAHPLAQSWAQLEAADDLLHLVAAEAMAGRPSAERGQLARAAAAEAALDTAYVVHQAMGGLSFAEETGVAHLSTRIRQWSLLLPDAAGIDPT
jgi:alkylation response protein AidB-like acyl-CoA dehydrogenase